MGSRAPEAVSNQFDFEQHLDANVTVVGRRLAARHLSRSTIGRIPQEQSMAIVGRDPKLRAALFQLVDVAPACRDAGELASHLDSFLSEVPDGGLPVSVAGRAARGGASAKVTGKFAWTAINQMAHRFIVGETPDGAAKKLGRLWKQGSAVSVDLLGEATLTTGEGVEYAKRCGQALSIFAAASADWPADVLLESDSVGPIPRANLSVKVTALTPHTRAAAPDRGRRDAADHLRTLLRRAAVVGAHLHIDMESMDSREMILGLVLDVLAEEEFREGPSAGLVLQAYLRDSDEVLDEILAWSEATPRRYPLTVRLVKGAYWDQERIDAVQHGWNPPVWSEKAESDRCFERLTRRLIDSFPKVRPAIASHNLRSLSHAIAYAQLCGLEQRDLELQVLRGLGDDLAEAIAREGYRGRVYCPVGDLVSGMAYLVRRLLENTSNDSFLADRAAGADLDALLARP
jgi:proline dehydrogenase